MTREIMDYRLRKFNLAKYLQSIGSLGSWTDPGYEKSVGYFKTKLQSTQSLDATSNFKLTTHWQKEKSLL